MKNIKATKPFMLLVAVVVLFIIVKTSHAGFSYFAAQNEVVPVNNSQNLALLEQKPNLKSGPTTPTMGSIVDNSVLASNLSLTGVGGAEPFIPTSDEISIYVVQEGDTLSQIGQMFGVSVNTIKWANDITGHPQIGDILVILPVSGVRHMVEKGDTLETVAKKYNSKASDIAKFNGLSDSQSKLTLGTEVIVPNGEIESIQTPDKTPVKNSGANIVATPTKNLPKHSGFYIRPVVGGVRTQGIHGNNAVDLAHSLGVPIYASAGGSVIVAKTGGWNGGYGNYIVISHSNGSQTLYAHLNSVSVSVGQTVGQGEVIGALGSSGNSTGPHVHFEIRGAQNPF
ncbi:MAG: M23 family metallopeptidase [Candidatus Paceibacterota bacterium]